MKIRFGGNKLMAIIRSAKCLKLPSKSSSLMGDRDEWDGKSNGRRDTR